MSDVLSPWVTLIEAEVNLLMAIGTTITGTAVYYGGFLAAEFIARNRRKFKRWIAIFQAVAAARSELKVIAPTLYSKLFDALFEFYVRSLTPKNAASVIGKIIGLGGVALLERKLGLIKEILTLIPTTVLALLKNVADSLARAEQLWSTGIRALVAELQAQDVTVTPQEQRAIFEEIRAHPDEIRRIFQRLAHEIDAHLEGATWVPLMLSYPVRLKCLENGLPHGLRRSEITPVPSSTAGGSFAIRRRRPGRKNPNSGYPALSHWRTRAAATARQRCALSHIGIRSTPRAR